MSQLPIDKNIPLPVKYPFADMQVGDSFALPEGVQRTSVNVAAKRFGEQHNKKFTVRQMPDKTFRCWRIA